MPKSTNAPEKYRITGPLEYEGADPSDTDQVPGFFAGDVVTLHGAVDADGDVVINKKGTIGQYIRRSSLTPIKENPMNENTPVFTGTPADWWDQAEKITIAEAENRTFGDWYITQQRGPSRTSNATYRLMTPTNHHNSDQLQKARAKWGTEESRFVRRLISGGLDQPAWMTSDFVIAELYADDSTARVPWIRKPNGYWACATDGRIRVNDTTMALLNPAPATITENLEN